ncbi:hypothetical protein BDV95DRAFT_559485 [Massariosphaeria phaeospora]|uniref:NmrA-like domain-containing protein n=1 Tax=Massariosphaeria phaeospora TaxID=100035 RepID=A0A7C8IEC7_9PLEO|nr:hypothetical protein BDV95DRAFT_559485 [Massariosphaeria phaeospora]
MSRSILVTGATGRQGGSVVQALQDSDFEVLALTRTTSSPSAQKLVSKFPSVKLVQGDLINASAIFEEAAKVARTPVWGVFSVQAKVSGADKSPEEIQGKSIIDAALAANVKFFVYSSVDRGGAKSSSNPTSVPHWITKYNIEKYLEEKAAGTQMHYSVLRPVAFMDGVTNDFQGKAMAAMWRDEMKDRPLQMVATKDIGWFAAHAFKNSDDFAGQYISLAGAQITFAQANAIFREKFSKDLPTTYGLVAGLMLHLIKDINLMFKWLKKEGTAANISELKRINPQLTDFGTWLERDSTFRV